MPDHDPEAARHRHRWRRTAKATMRHLPRHVSVHTATGIALGTPLVERTPTLEVDVTEIARDVEAHAAAIAALFLAWCPRSGPRDIAVSDLEHLAEKFHLLASVPPREESPT